MGVGGCRVSSCGTTLGCLDVWWAHICHQFLQYFILKQQWVLDSKTYSEYNNNNHKIITFCQNGKDCYCWGDILSVNNKNKNNSKTTTTKNATNPTIRRVHKAHTPIYWYCCSVYIFPLYHIFTIFRILGILTRRVLFQPKKISAKCEFSELIFP